MNFRRACAVLLLLGPTACGATVDPLGTQGVVTSGPPEPDSSTLKPLKGPSTYPNVFRDVLAKTEREVDAKLEAAFQRLFHGDPTSDAIYFSAGEDRAYIQDILHGDVRTEGIGLGMLIALELDHREEFDRLWSYAAAALRYPDGPQRGYFRSNCSDGPCSDPYGQEQLTTALLFAHGRWGSRTGSIDYGAEALRSLEAMRALRSGGDVTSLFDLETQLIVDEPHGASARITRPSNVMPAYYALWAQATGDEAWLGNVSAARAFLQEVAHPKTGLIPLRARFDGTPEPGSEAFMPEGYRVQLNMTLDYLLTGTDTWYPSESDALLEFFSGQGPSPSNYGSSYPLEGGRCLDCSRSAALVAMNGVSAVPATIASRNAFIEAAWENEPLSGEYRYYDGMMHMLSLLTLSGRLRIY